MKKIILAAMLFSTSSIAAMDVYKCESKITAMWDLESDSIIKGTIQPKAGDLIMAFDPVTGEGSIDTGVFYTLKFTYHENGVYAGERQYISKNLTSFVEPDEKYPTGELRMFTDNNKKVRIYKCFKQE